MRCAGLISGGRSWSSTSDASLRAALHPAQTDYLYFVSDAAGHTRFSVNLKEHAQQVQAYRQAEKH